MDSATAPSQAVNVPVKVNAAGLAEALSKMAAAAPATGETTMVNPAAHISVAGHRIPELYRQFSLLQELAKKLNGLPLDAPPPVVLGLKVTVAYSPAPAEATSASMTFPEISRVGDIVPLLNNEITRVLAELQKELATLQPVAAAAQAAVEKAITAWLQNRATPVPTTVSLQDETKTV